MSVVTYWEFRHACREQSPPWETQSNRWHFHDNEKGKTSRRTLVKWSGLRLLAGRATRWIIRRGAATNQDSQGKRKGRDTANDWTGRGSYPKHNERGISRGLNLLVAAFCLVTLLLRCHTPGAGFISSERTAYFWLLPYYRCACLLNKTFQSLVREHSRSVWVSRPLKSASVSSWTRRHFYSVLDWVEQILLIIDYI